MNEAVKLHRAFSRTGRDPATILASIPMRASGRRRSALTLLVVVLLGGIIMPGVDAMLFHGRGAGTTFGARLEATSSGEHAIQCPQADQLRSGRALAATPPQTNTATPIGIAVIVCNTAVLLSTPVHTPVLPRAPPSLLA
jgi:hypothetical protein